MNIKQILNLTFFSEILSRAFFFLSFNLIFYLVNDSAEKFQETLIKLFLKKLIIYINTYFLIFFDNTSRHNIS